MAAAPSLETPVNTVARNARPTGPARAAAGLALIAATLASVPAAMADGHEAATDMAPRPAIAGVVAAGLGGSVEYTDAFESAATTIAEALATLDPTTGAVARLGETGDRPSDRDALLAEIEQAGAADADLFALVLIGHGGVDGKRWKFNVAGPDPSGDDLLAALAVVRAPRQLVVLGASASGALIETLAQPGRVVVTATKSGGELNAVRFPGFLADAMGSAVADVDRNEILTVAEAFRFAAARTREHYEEARLLASEHPRIVGDESVSLAVARLGSLRLAGDDPAVAALLDTRLALERRYRTLIDRKDAMTANDYYAELETLMLSIAGLQQAIDRASGWSDDDADN